MRRSSAPPPSGPEEGADAEAVGPGARLVRVREALGLSQRELAREFGVSSGAIALWEGGRRPMQGPALRLLELYEAEALPLAGASAPGARGRALEYAGAPSGWARRALPFSTSAAVWWGLRTMLRAADGNPIAERVRAASARRFADTLARSRGLEMKLGQMLGYMHPLLSRGEREALAALESAPHAMPPPALAEALVAQLGRTPRQLFARFGVKPFAVGSVGQVHEATLRGGEAVAVKVQYPDVEAAIRADLRHVKLLDRCYSLMFRGQPPDVLYAEMAERFLRECDYRLEAEHQAAFRQAFRGRPGVAVPRVYEPFSAPKVLTTELCAGETFARFARRASAPRRRDAAATLFRFHYEAIFRHGLFQTDLNPANLLFRDDAIVFLDFGRVVRYAPDFVAGWRGLVRAVLERRPERAVEAADRLGTLTRRGHVDAGFLYRYMTCFYRPLLAAEPFAFTPHYARTMWRYAGPGNVNKDAAGLTAEMAFWNQLTFGLCGVLSQLGVRQDYRTPNLDLFYGPGERPPPPFTRQELWAVDPALCEEGP